jgi:hypothetical protein
MLRLLVWVQALPQTLVLQLLLQFLRVTSGTAATTVIAHVCSYYSCSVVYSAWNIQQRHYHTALRVQLLVVITVCTAKLAARYCNFTSVQFDITVSVFLNITLVLCARILQLLYIAVHRWLLLYTRHCHHSSTVSYSLMSRTSSVSSWILSGTTVTTTISTYTAHAYTHCKASIMRRVHLLAWQQLTTASCARLCVHSDRQLLLLNSCMVHLYCTVML